MKLIYNLNVILCDVVDCKWSEGFTYDKSTVISLESIIPSDGNDKKIFIPHIYDQRGVILKLKFHDYDIVDLTV